MKVVRAFLLSALCSISTNTNAQERFAELVGQVAAQPVRADSTLSIPYITWGGDVVAFHANGGLSTKEGSEFANHKLKIKFTPGDNFVEQVKNYLKGETPFLRGTMRMLGQASEVIGSDPRTQPVVFLQLSWSKGDHIVARSDIRSLDQLKGKRIACQQGGPHVGLLYDSLTQVKLVRNDVEIVWVSELTGEHGPAELFRIDPSIDACCVITPDMIGLTGGIGSVGTGAEGTVKGAYVLNSTQQMSGSIADVYAVRSDWYAQNRDTVDKFTAGYLKATEVVRSMRDEFETSHRMSASYKSVLQMAQTVFGEDVLPSLEIDAHGLLLDCQYARLTGQIEFFDGILDTNGQMRKSPIGFEAKTKAATDLAVNWNYASKSIGFTSPKLNYEEIAGIGGLQYVKPKIATADSNPASPKAEGVKKYDFGGDIDDETIFSFEILFDVEQSDFPFDRYEADFQRAIETAGLYKDAIIAIRGHSDTARTLIYLLRSGKQKKLLKRVRKQWYFNGKPMELSDTDKIVDLIKTGKFSAGIPRTDDPMAIMQAALNLSKSRAERVKERIVELAAKRGISLNDSQLQPVGVGIADPVVPVPNSPEAGAPNRRVEFRIMRISSETTSDADYDLLGGSE